MFFFAVATREKTTTLRIPKPNWNTLKPRTKPTVDQRESRGIVSMYETFFLFWNRWSPPVRIGVADRKKNSVLYTDDWDGEFDFNTSHFQFWINKFELEDLNWLWKTRFWNRILRFVPFIMTRRWLWNDKFIFHFIIVQCLRSVFIHINININKHLSNWWWWSMNIFDDELECVKNRQTNFNTVV